MHISEGVLTMPVLAAGWALAAGGLGVGLKKTAVEKLPETALVSAALFLAALVHVPIGPSSVHLTLLGLAGVMLGWSVVPALFIALLLQGLLFQFGGLLSLGVNTTIMSAAALGGGAVYRLFPEKYKMAGAFAAGFAAVLTGTALVATALLVSDMELRGAATLLLASNLPLAAVEGVVTLFIVSFLSRMLPDYVS